jgi:tetratricopeptide (TPR) repeat protein
MGVIIYGYRLIGYGDTFILGILTYVALAIILRNLIAKSHRRGVRLTRQQKFSEAIPFFEKSVDYFSKNSLIDKYRFLTLLSSSKMRYREMGLCNIAFCYSQTGKGSKAKRYYEEVLKAFPENSLAIAGLNMLNSVDTKAQVSE